MTLRKLIVVLLTICLSQLINSFLTNFFLLGIFQLIETQMNEDRTGGTGGSTGAIASIKLISNLSIYGRPVLKALFGFSFSIYFIALLLVIKILHSHKKFVQLSKYAQSSHVYLYLLITIVFNLLLASFLVYLDLRQKKIDNEFLENYERFKQDLARILDAHSTQTSKEMQRWPAINKQAILDVRHSIATLKTTIYSGNFNTYLTVFIMIGCSGFTLALIIGDFF